MKRTLPFILGIAISIGFGWVALKPLFSGVVLGASTAVSATATKTFNITARQWEFDPSTITVDKGDSVTLNITSEDVTHGFSLPQFGVSKTLSPGATTTATFIADEAGTFTFSCSVSCGTGHSSMRGTLVVNEEEESEDDSNDAENENTNDDSDENENVNESEQEDTAAPILSGVVVGKISPTSATVTWTTDEPAKGRIEYGTASKSYPKKTADEKAELTTHGLQVTGLTASTTYFLRVMNADESGNAGYSSEVSFTTTQSSQAANQNANSATANTASTNAATTKTSSGEPTNTNTSSSVTAGVPGTVGKASAGTAIAAPVPKLERAATPTSSVTIQNAPVPEVVTGSSQESGSQTTAATPTFQASVGDPLTFEGTATPNSDVTITIQSNPIVRTTKSDSQGKWSYIFRETNLLEPGDHTVTVAVNDQTAQTTAASSPVTFRIVPAEKAVSSSSETTESRAIPSWGVWGMAAVLVALCAMLISLIVKRRKN